MALLDVTDLRQLRNVLGTFTTGVTIVTTRDAAGVLHGVTANSFSSVSLDPPLVLWSQALSSTSLDAFRSSDHFAVNILADDQIALSNHFAKSKPDKFAGIEHTLGLGDVPVLPGTVAHLECVKAAEYPAGDHVIYLGRVERLSSSGRRPLAFAHGRYMVPYAHELGPMPLKMGSAPAPSPALLRRVVAALPEVQRACGGHSVCVAVWGNHGPTTLYGEAGSLETHEQLYGGLVVSTTRTATGLAFAAFLPAEVTKIFIDEDLRLSRRAEEDAGEQRARFEQAAEFARGRGVAVMEDVAPAADGKNVAIHAFSAPVNDAEGRMVLALSTLAAQSSPDAGWDGPLPDQLRQAAARLSESGG